MNAAFQWSSLLPLSYLGLLAGAGVVVLILARWKRMPDFYGRGLFFMILAFLLLYPLVVHEVRQALPNKVVIVVDDSPSQNMAGRHEAAEKILSYLQGSLSRMPGIEPVVIRAGQDAVSAKNQNTSLFSALQDSLFGLPLGQIAGTVFITDGQVHDVPKELGPLAKIAPLHVVLTGQKNEFDRKVTIVEAPKYGLLSQDVTIKVKVDDHGAAPGTPILLNIQQDGKLFGQQTMVAGEEQSYTFKLEHPGQNVFEFSTAVEKDELTPINNTAAVIVNGVRDRLRVLLVSGMPHVGERAWRDLLKSDPSIDLIHFTILRSPTSFDNTPQREMALIAFPVTELFENKIKDFDLIIFDKYAQYGLLQPQYFQNIASLVKSGGAFLMAMGSDQPEQSLFETALGDILPVQPKLPEKSILSGAYLPQLTDLGKTHPVTGELQTDKKPWGRWLTQVDIEPRKGEVLMSGAQGRPLLVLDKVGEGRVAVLTSDNIWLWSKGMDGGGPYTDLLRNVAHWLMKEPELEEDFIKAEAKGNVITVSERAPAAEAKTVTLTKPDRQTETVALTTREKGWARAQVTADQNGIYRFDNGSRVAFAIVGSTSSPEFSEVHTTAEKFQPLIDQAKGGVIWYTETPQFSLKAVGAASRTFGGRDWIGLKENDAYTVSRVDTAALVPKWLSLLMILAGLLAMWRRESGKKQ